MTLALRHVDPRGQPGGVFTVDFFLKDLSRGLAGLTESGRNDAVLLGADGLVLANAGAERPPNLAGAASALYANHRDAINDLAEGQGVILETASVDVPYRVALRRIADRFRRDRTRLVRAYSACCSRRCAKCGST